VRPVYRPVYHRYYRPRPRVVVVHHVYHVVHHWEE
jgi:hypothetical protein